MEYAILREGSLEQLVVTVNKAIATGWKPLGGVAIHGYLYVQAMTFEPVDKIQRWKSSEILVDRTQSMKF